MPLQEEGAAEPRGFLKIMRDRTVEREADRRLDTMTAALPGFVFVSDTDGNHVEINEQFLTYTGRNADELIGAGWIEVLHEEDRARATEIWGHAVRTGETYEARYRFRRHDGEYRCFACRGVPERDSLGRIVRWLGTCIDVESEARARSALEKLNLALEHRATQSDADLGTAIEDLRMAIGERRQAEDALRQAQKMEAVGQLTGGVAHDFNNLLTIIRSSVDLLRRPNLAEEKRERYLSAIADTADRAAALTRQLLAFARRQPLQPERFDAATRVDEVANILRTTLGSRIRLMIEKRCEPCLVEADPNQFDTALLNMAVNARDAMDGEGELSIVIALADALPARRHHASSTGEYIAVSVTDNGAGMAPDTLVRIFEPFFTTKEVGKGTGLGLSQVFGFAKQSGGDVAVESKDGKGSTFTIYLPHAQAEAPVVDTPRLDPVAEAPEATRCILVVEDNQTVGEFAAQLLDELGYGTMWAGDAQAAIKLIEEKPDHFDVVFSDVVMPGMSGIDMAQLLRQSHPGLRIVLTSGYSHVLAEEGTHGFPLLHKPYSVEALSRILRSVVREA